MSSLFKSKSTVGLEHPSWTQSQSSARCKFLQQSVRARVHTFLGLGSPYEPVTQVHTAATPALLIVLHSVFSPHRYGALEQLRANSTYVGSAFALTAAAAATATAVVVRLVVEVVEARLGEAATSAARRRRMWTSERPLCTDSAAKLCCKWPLSTVAGSPSRSASAASRSSISSGAILNTSINEKELQLRVSYKLTNANTVINNSPKRLSTAKFIVERRRAVVRPEPGALVPIQTGQELDHSKLVFLLCLLKPRTRLGGLGHL